MRVVIQGQQFGGGRDAEETGEKKGKRREEEGRRCVDRVCL